jgi:hypothetical protein
VTWFARTFNAGTSPITASEPLVPDAVIEPAPDLTAAPFGPDLVRADSDSAQNTVFAGGFSMRMRGLEPAAAGLPPDDTPRPGATQQDKKPRTSGVFRLTTQSDRATAGRGETVQDTPDLVPIWSEIGPEGDNRCRG